MPTIPCPQKITCPCENSPFANLSSEAPDLPVFTSTVFVKVTPPLGTNWDKQGCLFTCQSSVSQQAADLCAAEQAFLCATGNWTFDGGGKPNGPVPPPVSTAGNKPVSRFFNAQQTGEAICPDGLPFSFTVPPGVFAALSQAAADAGALSYANRQAQLHMICLSNITDIVCVDVPYNAMITATGKFLAVAPQADTWQVIGTLPPGLTFEGNPTGGLAFISGTPTTPGQFNFFVSITDPSGDTMEKLYVFNVCGITDSLPDAKVGQAYNGTLTTAGFNSPIFIVAGGSPLPSGLTLLPNGQISGTPTTAGTSTFAVEIADTVTGLVCVQDVTLTVKQGCGPTPSLLFTQTFSGNAMFGVGWRSNPPPGPNNSPLLLATDSGSEIAYSINLNTLAVNQISLAAIAHPDGICYCPANDKFIVQSNDGFIIRVTPEPLAVFDSINTSGGLAHGPNIVFNPGNGLCYFYGGNSGIGVYDPVGNSVVAEIDLGTFNDPIGLISFDTVNNLMYVGVDAENDAELWIFDVSHSMPVFLQAVVCPFGDGATMDGAIFCPDNGLVYCQGTNFGPFTTFVSRYKVSTGTFINTETGRQPNGQALAVYNPVTKLVFLPCLTVGGYDVYCALTDSRIGAVTSPHPFQSCFVGFGNSSVVFASAQTGSTSNEIDDYG